MAAFFDKVLDFFNLIWDVIVQLVDSLITLFEVIQTSLQLPAFIYTIGLPTILVSSATAVVAIVLAKLIVGR